MYVNRACHVESFKCHILNTPSRSPENDFNTYADMCYEEYFRSMFCEKVVGFMTERNISRSKSQIPDWGEFAVGSVTVTWSRMSDQANSDDLSLRYIENKLRVTSFCVDN